MAVYETLSTILLGPGGDKLYSVTFLVHSFFSYML